MWAKQVGLEAALGWAKQRGPGEWERRTKREEAAEPQVRERAGQAGQRLPRLHRAACVKAPSSAGALLRRAGAARPAPSSARRCAVRPSQHRTQARHRRCLPAVLAPPRARRHTRRVSSCPRGGKALPRVRAAQTACRRRLRSMPCRRQGPAVTPRVTATAYSPGARRWWRSTSRRIIFCPLSRRQI